MVGRPSKRTPEREARLLEAIRGGATRKVAALHAGICERTLFMWLKNADFAESIARAEADVELRLTAIILQAAVTDAKHAEWWLERRRPDDYARREKLDLEVYVRQRAAEMGIDEQEALEIIRPQLKLASGQ